MSCYSTIRLCSYALSGTCRRHGQAVVAVACTVPPSTRSHYESTTTPTAVVRRTGAPCHRQHRFFSSSRSDNEPPNNQEAHVKLTTLTNPDVPGATVALLTLNRPPANAMGRLMVTQLQDSLAAIEQSSFTDHHDNKNESISSSPPPRCLVICSALAPKVFSAGADLKERATMTVDEAAVFVTRLRQTMHRVACLPVPVLACLEGVAVGGGLELALAADIRVASANVRLGLPETSLAIVPGAGGTQRLPRLIGMARAKELVLTGRQVNAQQAWEYGLVQHVVAVGEREAANGVAEEVATTAMDKTLEMAWKIARNGPVAIRAAKWAMEAGMEARTMEEALEIERQGYAQVLQTKDRLEGLAAFKEGRSPEYKGF